MRLENKVAIVTGAGQGIGLSVARAFAEEGAHVVLADVDVDRGRSAAESIEGGHFVSCDVGSAEQAQALMDETVKRHGRIDVCVNNAGIIRTADVLELAEADFDAVMRVNLKGGFLVAQAAARVMARQGEGSIINMSSVNAVMTIPISLPITSPRAGSTS